MPADHQDDVQELAKLSQSLATEGLASSDTQRWAQQAASIFMGHCFASGIYIREAIDVLCQMAALPEGSLAEAGSRALFSLVVEGLNDSFDPNLSLLYDRVMAQTVFFCQGLPTAGALRHGLRRFEMTTEDDLVARARHIRQIPRWAKIDANIRKALILSRVTLGADVAITSVLLTKLKALCPDADLVLLGGDSLRQLFGGDSRIRLRCAAYDRHGSLLARLNAWTEIISAIDEELAGLAAKDWVILDPDSRLSQLGVLPLVHEDSQYFLFPSRAYPATDARCLSELAAEWLNTISGTHGAPQPYVNLQLQDIATAQRLLGWLRSGGKPLLSINFSVSPNPQKRLDNLFEESLVLRLLDHGARVVLAKGGAPDDIQRAEALLGRLQHQDVKVVEVGPNTLDRVAPAGTAEADILAWDGAIGPYAALMAGTDAYVGYDSACQHIAAALGVPVVDIFAGYPNATFVKRWRPYGRGPVHTIEAGTGEGAAFSQASLELVDKVIAALGEMVMR